MSTTGAAAGADRRTEALLRAAIESYHASAEQALERVAARWNGPAPLAEAMRYAVLGPGKRLRPVLVFAACEAAGGDPARAAAPAVAVELVHAYSLVHDDLPPMDDDDERRGKPTVHIAFGEANAILVGDALLTEAFSVIAGDDALTPEQRVRCVSILAQSAGPNGMVGGQVLDISGAATTPEQLLRMHAAKTGALFEAACRMGAVCATASAAQVEHLAEYARSVGEAFQIGDDMVDLLDLDEADTHEASVNLAARYGPADAAQRVDDAVVRALAAAAALPGGTDTLEAIARWTRTRAADALARASR